MADDDKALVERLRANDTEIYLPILGEAADRIEDLSKENDRLNANLAVEAKFVDKLSAENERLREALKDALSHCYNCSGDPHYIGKDEATGDHFWTDCPICRSARAALGETK